MINFNDISLFIGYYVQYWTNYNPATVGIIGNGGLGADQDNLSQTVTLSLNGPAVLPSVGSSFNVTLNVNNVSGLWGWGSGLQWNPNAIELTNITEGPFLQSAGSTLFLNSLDDPIVISNGTLRDMGNVLMSDSTANGSGTLATFTFQVLSNTATNVTFTGSELEAPCNGTAIQPIPCTVSNLQVQALPPPTGIFVADEHETTNQDWSVGPTPNPINTTIGVDVRVFAASNIWGWSIPNITWDPQVLQLTGMTEGPFLSANTGDNPTIMTGNSPSSFDNLHGTIIGGLSEAIQGAGVSTGSAGVVATLWFNLTGSGISNINLSGATLYANSTDAIGGPTNAYPAAVTVNAPSPYIFSDDFESGNFGKWSVVQGYPYSATPTISSAKAHTGTYNAYFPASSGETNEVLGADFAPQSSVDARFYLNPGSLSQSCPLCVHLYASNGDQISVGFDSATGQFALTYYNNNDDWDYFYMSSAQQVTSYTWLCVEIALSPTTFTLYYNGVSILTGALTDGPTGQFSNVSFQSYTWAGSVAAFYIDDVVVSTSYIGP